MAEEFSAYPWPSYYGHFNFFEARMRGHSRIKGLKNDGGGVYDLTLTTGDTKRIFICECYSFGAAEYVETNGKLGSLDAIIINSAWCGYPIPTANHFDQGHDVSVVRLVCFFGFRVVRRRIC